MLGPRLRLRELSDGVFGVVQVHAAVLAINDMPLDLRALQIVERSERVERSEFFYMIAHVLLHAASATPSLRKPSAMRLFTVPSGSFNSLAISTCVFPPKYASVTAVR